MEMSGLHCLMVDYRKEDSASRLMVPSIRLATFNACRVIDGGKGLYQ
jgi:hypothetical protein